jgi:hypothetical protein
MILEAELSPAEVDGLREVARHDQRRARFRKNCVID